MQLLIWNISTSVSRLCLLLHQHSLVFLAVIDLQQPVTRLQRAKIQLCFSSYLSLCDDLMWCFWHSDILDLQEARIVEQVFHLHLCIYTSNISYRHSCVYGHHTIADRRTLWVDLTSFGIVMSDPLLISGDFNFFLHLKIIRVLQDPQYPLWLILMPL